MPGHTGAGHREARGGSDDLRQRHQPLKGGRVGRHIALRPVGQLLHPVQDADRNFPSAGRAASLGLLRLLRRQPLAAGTVTVQVIFTLLREELQRSPEGPVPGVGKGPDEGGIAALHLDDVGLPPQLGRRMRVGIGDQPVSIQRGQPPVHGRV